MLYGEHAKCQAEAEYPELWQGLVGAWSPCLSARGGAVLRDLSGRGNHGTLTNMDAATDWVVSGGRQALDFDGSNDYVDCGIINLASPFTFSLRIKFSALTTKAIASDYKNTVAASWYTGLSSYNSGDTDFYAYSSPTAFVGVSAPSGTFTTGVWYHIAYVYFGGSSFAIYKDGVSLSLTPRSGGVFTGMASSTTPLYLAAYASNTGLPLFPIAAQISDSTLHRGVAWTQPQAELAYRLGPGGWATPRRRRWNYATAQTAIPYWVFARKNARLIGGGVS